MREQLKQRRSRQGTANMTLQEAERSGKLITEAEHINYAWDGKPIIRDFSTTILRGDRIGIIGPNGVGKTTLIKILLGELTPDTGRLKLGHRIEVSYFDQLRAALDENKTVADNVADGHEKVDINGTTKHIISYLQDFLFTPDRTRQPVRALSGGERNRLLLAKLFAKPSNVLVMDEPTNDLDIETLELLEELLMEYKGTLLLVSHDRAFINNVVTSTLVFEDDGLIHEYVGDYDDWLRQRPGPTSAKQEVAREPRQDKPSKTITDKPKKLSYKDQRELDQLPQKIEALETELGELQEQMSKPDFYQQDSSLISEAQSRLEQLENDLAVCYERWELLEEQRA
jgi:ATP-binding cassette subfamily F protein uup